MTEKNQPRRNWVFIILAGLSGLFACVCLMVAGFAIGRATATPQTVTETITQLLEVTREVPVLIEGKGDSAMSSVGEAAESDDISTTTVDNNTPAAEPVTATPVATEAPNQPEPSTGADFSIYYEAWDIVGDQYDGEVPPSEELIYSAIEGSLRALDDPYTRFVPPEIAERLREDLDGSVEGIGAIVRENDDGFIEIVRPIDGQPADLAGLRAGDLIVAVDGQSVIGQTLDEVVLQVRGPSGTAVTLEIEREDSAEPLEFTIVRARFEVPVVESELLPQNIAYVHLTEFNRNAEEKMLQALGDLLAQDPQGLILDLRDNPGGLLDQSVAIADIFLADSVVLLERNNRGLERTYRADDGDVAETIPLVVLVNEGSASAAEIVAGAIQDNDRAILIGETTFGKGSVQNVHQLSDGSELRVTVARWYTPSNNSISGEGITPDIEAPTPDDLGGEDDGQLQRAIDYILNGQ
jgi:carboxyl-terminal processing protease